MILFSKISLGNDIYILKDIDIEIGKIDTLKINNPKILNLKNINWTPFEDYFRSKDIVINKLGYINKNETWFLIQPLNIIDEKFDSIPIEINLLNNSDTTLFISQKINVFINDDINSMDFKEIKPIEDVPFRFSEIWSDSYYRKILISLFIFIIIIFIIIKLILKNKNQIEKKSSTVKITYLDYIKRLKKLKKTNYLKDEKFKIFYSELSNIFKEYIEFKFNINAIEQTSSDLIFKLNKNKILYPWMIEFLNNSDLVKFAKHIPVDNKEEFYFNQILIFINHNSINKKNSDD